MAARKMSPPKRWPRKKDTERALFVPRAEEAWCSLTTAFWLTERVSVDLPIPGMGTGDIPGGKKLAGSWDGLAMYQNEGLRPGVVMARRERRTYHVRLELGEVHEGHPDQCDDGICLAERIMDE